MKIYILLLAFVLVGCSQPPPAVSPSFHGLPEDGAEVGTDDVSRDEEIVGPLTEDYADVTSSALEDGEVPVTSHPLATGDRVPWHMEYLMTDLSVSASGLLGGLIMKGSPAITFIWRKQKPAHQPSSAFTGEADLSVSDTSSASDIAMQLEPAMKMAMRSGRVKNETKFRASLLSAARDFQALGQSIGENPGHQWWVSRLRLDLTLDATGAVTPVIGLGGDLRFRFEWHRIMKAKKSSEPKMKLLGVPPSSLRQFISATASDLSVLSDETPRPDGFKAYSYRVGIGMSAKGDIGIVKSSASLIGQVYFSRDVAKPKVHSFAGEILPETINMIEDASSATAERHERFALDHQIEVRRESTPNGGQIVYKVDRKKIRKGLTKAAKMGLMFGRHASTATKGQWKVFELKTGLDLSISGKIGLTELTGQATSEIAFYNQSF